MVRQKTEIQNPPFCLENTLVPNVTHLDSLLSLARFIHRRRSSSDTCLALSTLQLPYGRYVCEQGVVPSLIIFFFSVRSRFLHLHYCTHAPKKIKIDHHLNNNNNDHKPSDSKKNKKKTPPTPTPTHTTVAYHIRNPQTFLLTNPRKKSKLLLSLCSVHTLPVPRSSQPNSSATSKPQSRVMPLIRARTPPSASSVTIWFECSQCEV
jgi:hypothetical protein